MGRMAALAWFITFSFVSIALGLVMVNLLHPGVGLALVPSGELGDPLPGLGGHCIHTNDANRPVGAPRR